MNFTRIQWTLYSVLLVSTGFLISRIPNANPVRGSTAGTLWFFTFLLLTFGFSRVRSFVLPLINLRPLREAKTYGYIISAAAVPFFLLKVIVHYEVFLEPDVIYSLKHPILMQQPDDFKLLEAALFTPVWEEILFRGILLMVCLRRMPAYAAILLSAVLFALFHSGYIAFMIIPSILLGLTAYKTKSVIPSMISHILWNIYIMKLIFYFPL
ncbi:lysostaphin resistance A-like protein [Peribacillus sp. SCS-26]|uniref:CPBP family intramembrane glutamic endopeptidase n=1 Tax=Paraperibacillus marinus TaxID=3115295 RepID=UPI003906BEF3